MLKQFEQKAVEGNAEVRQCLDFLMDNEKIKYIAVAYTTELGHFDIMQAGIVGSENDINTGLDVLKRRLLARIEGVSLVQNPTKTATADHVIFNLAKAPINFDFLSWLVVSEMTRIREGAPAPLKVQWFHGNENESSIDTPKKQQNFNGILRPLLVLFGAIEEEFGVGRLVESCSLGPAVEAYRAEESVPHFVVPFEILKMVQLGRPPVTITLRESDHYKQRNSDLPEWLKLARWLEGQGEEVLFIRDTANALEPVPGFKNCPQASTDLLIRAAVYAQARANLFVSNGPAMLAVFGDRPWLIFNEVQNDGTYPANTDDGWYQCAGIRPPEQWPWSFPDQRIIWKADTFEVMRDAWIEHIAG
jgi:hypothetical protein